MPTFKITVFKHQKRTTDGKYPVSIQVTQNRKHAYIKTGIYVEQKQINRRSFQLSDSFVIERLNKTMREMETALLRFSTKELSEMSATQIKCSLTGLNQKVDYLDYCRLLIAADAKKWGVLRSAVSFIGNQMHITQMPIAEFNVQFIERMKKMMDDSGNLNNRTKNHYLTAMGTAFRKMKKSYNTEYVKVIDRDPFEFVDRYKEGVTRNGALNVVDLRKLFEYKSSKKNRMEVLDLVKISFCLCGMNVADMFDVSSSCLKDGRLTYERKKTRDRRTDNALISIRVEPEISSIIGKYRKSGGKLFDVFESGDPNNWTHLINEHLKRTCRELDIQEITMYWIRHTWATIARNDCGISKDDIDLCLDHVGNNSMADIYVHSDWSIIDVSNRKVLDYVFGKTNSRVGESVC